MYATKIILHKNYSKKQQKNSSFSSKKLGSQFLNILDMTQLWSNQSCTKKPPNVGQQGLFSMQKNESLENKVQNLHEKRALKGEDQ